MIKIDIFFCWSESMAAMAYIKFATDVCGPQENEF